MSSPFGNPQPGDPFAGQPQLGQPQPGQPHLGQPQLGQTQRGGLGDKDTAVFDRPEAHWTTEAAPAAKPLTPVTGPWPFVITAFSCALVAIVCAVCAVTVGGTATDTLYRYFAISGWGLGGIFSLIALGLHFAANNRRQAESFYIENSAQTLLARATLVLSSIAVIATAAEIALWLSKTIGN